MFIENPARAFQAPLGAACGYSGQRPLLMELEKTLVVVSINRSLLTELRQLSFSK